MLAVPMKTHEAGLAIAVLLVALTAPAGAQGPSGGVRCEPGSGVSGPARLEERSINLKARGAAIERARRVCAGGSGVAHVARLADGAMRRLVGTVGEWKHGRGRDAPD